MCYNDDVVVSSFKKLTIHLGHAEHVIICLNKGLCNCIIYHLFYSIQLRMTCELKLFV